ncbi:hypothetical protein EV121DRAFT_217957 [Schizophyllum commune]
MAPITVPPPRKAKSNTIVLRSHLERRLREERHQTPHIFHGLLIHALWENGYARDALASDAEFVELVKRDVERIKDQLCASLPGVLMDDFHVNWRFGDTYHKLWKAHQVYLSSFPPPTKAWAEEETRAQGGMQDEGRTTVYFHVGADLAQTLTLQADTFEDVFIVGNVLRRLVAKGVDPSNASLFVRLPNGALLQINWYDALPVPAPPFERVIELELHRRVWRAPATLLTRQPTGRTYLCAFYTKFSDQPLFFDLPVLEGGWIELALARRFLRENSVRDGGNTIILRGSSVNPSCQMEATWIDPIPIPPESKFVLVFRFFCRKCLLKDAARAHGARAHFCNAA